MRRIGIHDAAPHVILIDDDLQDNFVAKIAEGWARLHPFVDRGWLGASVSIKTGGDADIWLCGVLKNHGQAISMTNMIAGAYPISMLAMPCAMTGSFPSAALTGDAYSSVTSGFALASAAVVDYAMPWIDALAASRRGSVKCSQG